MSSVQPDPWERWSPLSGVVYVVLFITALGVSSGPGDTPAEVARYYADGGNRDREVLVFFLIVAATLAFLWFLGLLRVLFVRAEPEPARWTALGFAAGVTSAACLLAAAAAFVGPAFAAGEDEFALDPNTWNVLSKIGSALLVGSVMAASLLVLATSIVALRTRVLPRWTALTGFVVAAVMLFTIFLFPLFVWLAWVLAVSTILVLRTARVAGWRRLGAHN
jgi:hypothetical protein